MQLALKFTLAFIVGMCVIFAIASYFRVQREVALFEDDIRCDHEGVGRDLATAVSTIWRLAGEADALQFIEQANRSRSNISIRWVSENEGYGDNLAPATDLSLTSLRAGGEALFLRQVHDGEPWLFTYVAVPETMDRPVALELSESLAAESHYVRATLLRTVTTTALVALCTGAVAVSLGVAFVGRPVNALIEQARRVARGDLSGRLRTGRSDELGLLAQELNAMCETLAEANQRVEEESTARQRASEQLRHAERLTLVGKLASSVAHELGTPLNVILARAKMIALREVEGDKSVDNARIIVDQTVRITAAIHQLLDFARRRPSRQAPMDVRNVARQTVALLSPAARQRRVALQVEAENAPATANIDPDQIQQVLSNLVMNGIQAMAEGGDLTLSVQRERRPQQGADAERAVDTVCIHVRDQGGGIPAEYRSRIFEPFFTSKSGEGGTGLGLPIAADIVEEHGGWIEVESRPGDGATFIVCLPCLEQACAAES